MAEIIKMESKPERTRSGPSAGQAVNNANLQSWRKAIATLISPKSFPDKK